MQSESTILLPGWGISKPSLVRYGTSKSTKTSPKVFAQVPKRTEFSPKDFSSQRKSQVQENLHRIAAKLGKRTPWLHLISEVNVATFMYGSYFLPRLYACSKNRQYGRLLGETFFSLLENHFYQLNDLHLNFVSGFFREFLSTLPRCNIYDPLWSRDSFTTGGIIPFCRNARGEELLALSISSYSVITYLGGTREKNEFILETTLREFEEETRIGERTTDHFISPISMVDLHGTHYIMSSRHKIVLFFVEIKENPEKIRYLAEVSRNPETLGIMWVTWSQLSQMLQLASCPDLIISKQFYPFQLSNKFREVFRMDE